MLEVDIWQKFQSSQYICHVILIIAIILQYLETLAKALPITDNRTWSELFLSCWMPSKVCEGVCIEIQLELLSKETC